ncbi:class I histocompatibility antigen, F10 alpha chain-like [Etheostoma cragini]|uniref:class I histocompatibility antigen, F10 alpha chain-like n=1 Tax=Etheostoma cragini TaxID=417921 RepID=UPI00155E77F4|nr:class I histocompatibility antigen, F10 alpha chain-like [Etheostoma cragini]
MKWIQLLIPCLLMSTIRCGSHSLKFLSTGRVQPGDQPSFEQLTVFDGVPISYCDSVTKREQLKPTLESQKLPEHCYEASLNIEASLYEIPRSMNSNVYVVQRRRGCILTANGMSAFEAWAVDGTDFLSFDPESQRWTSHSPSAAPVEQRWNKNTLMNNAYKHFVRVVCPQMIQEIQLRSIQQQTELRVFAKHMVDTDQALLRCHVTTTDKSVSSVHLIGNGATRASWIRVTGPLPAENGSVILRLTADISQNQIHNTYGCTVQTGSHNITVFWDGTTLDGRNLFYLMGVIWKLLTVIAGVICTVSLVTIVSCASICLLKCVKPKSSPPSRCNPELAAQFTSFMESVASPDLQSVIFSVTQGREGHRESHDQWEVRIMLRDQSHYDPEFFADQIDGAQR